MKPSNTLWASVALCAVGLWAGAAGAQTVDEQGNWFADSPPAEAPAESAPRAEQSPESSPVELPPEPAAPSESPPEVTVPDYSVPPSDYAAPPADFQTPAPEAAAPEAPAPSTPEDRAAEAEGQQRAVQEFGPELAPYGSWVDDPWYGRIWVPSSNVVGSGFVPYASAGRWQLTPDGAWLWASDYPFGGITFHYGRWVWASGSVWGWVPGYVYAPAWVDFRIGAAGYIGWAPLAPHYVWRRGHFVSVGLWHAPPPIYCPTQYVFARSMPRYVVRDHNRVRSISAYTHPYRPRHGYGYVGRGPSPREAHIPAHALPTRRVLAQPRVTGSGRVPAQPRTAGSGRVLAQPHSAPSQYSREVRGEQRPQIRDYGSAAPGRAAAGRGARRGGNQNDSGWNSPRRSSTDTYSNTYGTPRVRSYDAPSGVSRQPSGVGRQEVSPGVRRHSGASNVRRPNPATRPIDAGQQWSSGSAAGSGQRRSGQGRSEVRAARPAQPEELVSTGSTRNVRRTAMAGRAPAPAQGGVAVQPREPRATSRYGTAPAARSYARSDGGQRATRRAGANGGSPSHGRSYSRSQSRSYR